MAERSFVGKSKKKIKQFNFCRMFIIILLLILQIVFFAVLWKTMRKYFFYSYSLTILLTFLAYVVIVNRKGNPGYKLVWFLPIILLPVFGILLYLFFEYQSAPSIINKKQTECRNKMSVYMEQDQEIYKRLKKISPEIANLSSYLYRNMQFPVYQNTDIKYYTCGEEFFFPFLKALEKAESFIFMEYFAFSEGKMWNAVLDILKRKAVQGVEVRFLYDGTNSFNNPYNYADVLRKYGIRCRVFNQIRPILTTLQNNRDHRKITVIDGRTAFTGGINLEDAYINAEVRYGYWKDTVIKVEGDAVRSFVGMFLQSWGLYDKSQDRDYFRFFSRSAPKILTEKNVRKRECGFVIPYCDSPLDEDSTGESVYIDILYTAKTYVHIMTPYLILDHEMITALTYAAKRGIDVKIIMPGIPDKPYAFAVAKTFYMELLQAGVKIYQFVPGFVHAKSFVSDDEKAVVGTINLDYRSLYLHFEDAVFFCGMDAVKDVEDDFKQTLLQCREVTEDTCRNEKIWNKIYGRMLRLIAPLM